MGGWGLLVDTVWGGGFSSLGAGCYFEDLDYIRWSGASA